MILYILLEKANVYALHMYTDRNEVFVIISLGRSTSGRIVDDVIVQTEMIILIYANLNINFNQYNDKYSWV